MTAAVPANGRRASRRTEDERSIDAIAERERASEQEAARATLAVIDAPSAPDLPYRAPDLAAEIAKFSSRPWIPMRLGDSVVTSARAGMVIALTAASGSGKSSLAIQIARLHSIEAGPVVYISVELDAYVMGGRAVGQALGLPWADVLSLVGVTAEQVAGVLAEMRRMIILDGERATLAHAEQAIATLRGEHPDQPVLVVVDYLQILPGDGREERIRVANIAEGIRRMAQRLGVVVLAVSQTSRASSKGLQDGDLLGADTTTTGAESSQIERMATATIAIGGLRQREDGTADVDISIGKSRFGGGDKVLPAVYDGRSGLWSIVGPAVSAAQRRAERSTANNGKRVEAARLAMAGKLAASAAPMSRNELRQALNLKRDDVRDAARQLLEDEASGVVEVRGRKAGGCWPLWTRDRAAAAGIDPVPMGARSDA